MKARVSRRRFLGAAALSGTGFLILDPARSAWSAQANEKLNIALVGVGGRGEWFVDTVPRMGNIVALCDVNDRKVAATFKRWTDTAGKFAASNQEWDRQAAPVFQRLVDAKPNVYRDFRKMFEAMAGAIDAVIVSTPDHTHAVVSAAALKAGKHVYCEKPLTRTVHESRALRELARRQKVATSMGNQGTAAGPFRRALELIRDGTLGQIKEVHVWNNDGGADRKSRPGPGGPAPDYLDWDLWLGPAADRPYHPDWLQRNLWRDFGTCQLGNWASHSANLAFMALKVSELWLAEPAPDRKNLLRISAQTSGVNRLSFPRWEKIVWEIPARAGLPPIQFTWYNGPVPGGRALIEDRIGDGLDWGDKKEKKWADHAGAVIVGTKGRLHATGHNATFRLLPEDAFKGIKQNEPQTVEASRGHEADWLNACKGGKPAWANFDYADALNEFLMLGNVATQFESALEFDPIAVKIVNDPQADSLLRSEYRPGWTL